MTTEQANRRTAIVAVLKEAGWTPTRNHELFERGEWFPMEASLEFRHDDMVLGCEYEAIRDWLHVYFEDASGLGIRLIIDGGEALPEVLRILVSVQDRV